MSTKLLTALIIAMLPRTSINPRILRAVFLPSVALLPVTTRSFSNRQILRCARGFSGVRAGQGGPLIGAPHGRSQWSDHPLVSKDSRNGLKRTRMRQITSVRRLSSSLLPASVHSITTNLFGTGALSGILPACTAARIYLLRSSTYVLSSLLILSHFGLLLEKRTHLGKALSAPLATMALALTMANVGLIPFASPVCKYFFCMRSKLECVFHVPHLTR